jgi:hypothetical protein
MRNSKQFLQWNKFKTKKNNINSMIINETFLIVNKIQIRKIK